MFDLSGAAGIGKTQTLCRYIFYKHKNDLDKGILVCEDTTKMLIKLHTWGYSGITLIDYDSFLTLLKKEKQGKTYYIDNLNRFAQYLGADGWTYNISDDQLAIWSGKSIK